MNSKRKAIIGGAIAVVAAAATGAGVTVARNSGDDTDVPIPAADLERASDAALAFTGEGRVTGTEVGDEESYYEVEVTLSNGSQVDIQLDRDFKVVSSSADGADGADDDTGGDDEADDD